MAKHDIIEDMNKIKFSFNPFNLNSITMAAGIAAVKDTWYLDSCVKKTVAAREQFKSGIGTYGISCHSLKG